MRAPTLRFLSLSLFVALIAGALFTTGLPGEFVFDDIPNIVNNDAIQLKHLDASGLLKTITTPQLSGDMRVLPTLSFALDYWRGGGADPATFRITSIFIHAVTACALAWLFRSLLLAAGVKHERVQWVAPALALGWALHPLQVSSVLYVVQRLQTMGTLFLVLALLAYMQARRAQLEGRSARTAFMASLLLWVMAMGCKEDSVLLPAYTLAIELTVLGFAAASPRTAILLRRAYLVATGIGAIGFLFWVLPHYWSWDAYPARDFSSPERLLTEARVLCLYLWQIVMPLPQNMPFYYDWVQPSRSLLHPWTTLPAIALLAALLVLAWLLRVRKPLFALGIFLFFGAHFITANVVGLELAFEHRNHFALIGMVLAVGTMLADVASRINLRQSARVLACGLLLILLGSATAVRARDWRSNLTLAAAGTEAAPHSARAWIQLCASQFKAGGGAVSNNGRLGEAAAACSNGASLAPYALNNAALLIVLKTLRGDVTPEDWRDYRRRIESVNMSWDNQRATTILTYHSRQGIKLDKQELLKTLAALSHRTALDPLTNASFGYFIMNDLGEPDLAMPYFIRAIQGVKPVDPFPQQLASELVIKGRPDLAAKIEKFVLARGNVSDEPIQAWQ